MAGKVIVATTINPPTEAIERFDEMPGWDLIVVGDLKTPRDYKLRNGTYLSPDDQEKYEAALSSAIGWNCVQRRNFGLLLAAQTKPDVIALIDDDNIPFEGWGENIFVGSEIEANYYNTELPAFDPIGATNYPALWHRGYPLQLLSKRRYEPPVKRRLRVDVQADFWDGDPDIDAICRMEHAPDCRFDPDLFPIASNRIAPFNSQNTFLAGSLLPYYFLFPEIGRMNDIWASYYLQAATNATVIFQRSSVYQARNPHDLIQDMRDEYLGYENNLTLVTALATDPKAILRFLPPRAVTALELYQKRLGAAWRS
jgi:hypothetical protein